MFKQNVCTVPVNVHLVFENIVSLQNMFMFLLVFKLLKLFIP